MNAETLHSEVHALSQCHPTARIVRTRDGKEQIHVFVPSKKFPNLTYEVVGVYPPGYPGSPIRFFVVNFDIPSGCPHLYNDGSLCLDHTGAFEHKSTGATAMAWVIVWLYCLDEWLASGSTINIWDTYFISPK